ncbi:MAG: sialate O-acetylesterase [Planctomycetota bacterium]
MKLNGSAGVASAMLLAIAFLQTSSANGQEDVASNKVPVKVFILMGQSNMVGMGDISGGGVRWGDEFISPVLFIYDGEYSPEANYDRISPVQTLELESFGGVNPTPYPDGGTHVVRGQIKMKQAGVYRFKPGYQASTHNIMEINGAEVHRREPGTDSIFNDIRLEADEVVEFKITYLTDSVNGLGWVQRTDIPGTLETVVNADGKFPELADENGNWLQRDDVTYKGVISAVGQGPLCAGIQGNTIGPELGFGFVVGDYLDEPVLLIKASIGNRSLGWDILPPGSERFEYDGRIYAGYRDTTASWIEGEAKDEVNWYAGKQYDEYVQATHDVLNEFDNLFPQFGDRGFEVAGFAWWQGHKDGNEAHASRYEQNLVRLINSLRSEFNAPDAPFVIATIGFDGWDLAGPHVTVANAQLAVSGETGNYPDFEGNVRTVETRDFWRAVQDSPRNQGYHYNRNAETYMLVGQALGKAMVELLQSDE